MSKKPLVVLDTNVPIRARRGESQEYRIMKDSKKGNYFKYAVTISQLEDLAGSRDQEVENYSHIFLKEIEKHKLEILETEKRKLEYPMRKILISGSVDDTIEDTDIHTVAIAMKSGAKCVVSNDEHLTWKGINNVIETAYEGKGPIELLKPKEFCEKYDYKLVNLNFLDKLKIKLIKAFEGYYERHKELRIRQFEGFKKD